MSSRAPAPPQATHQTTCYGTDGLQISCSGTGQDGELRAGVAAPDPRFTDRDNGTVRDNLTGLVWLKDAECLGKVRWSEALDRSNGLAAGSCALSDGSAAGDWRLPNFHELLSLMEWSRTTWTSGGKALIDGYPFSDVKQQLYWTSTTSMGGTDEARAANFGWSGVFKTEPKSLEYWVLPVRSDASTDDAPLSLPVTNQTECFAESGGSVDCGGTGQDGEIRAGVDWPEPRFTDNDDGTVTDHLTGLVWLTEPRCLEPDTYWGALDTSRSLSDGQCGLTDGSSAGDWRLPNFRELVSVFDWSVSHPMLTPGHPFDVVQRLHWTSTSSLPTGSEPRDQAWTISPYTTGNFHTATKTSRQQIWPVRDAR
ncbi:MAG: DUF1566 domain-containing protein [Gemmatimonadota bacterium]